MPAYLDPVSWLITFQVLLGGGGWLMFRFRKALRRLGVRGASPSPQRGIVRRSVGQGLLELTERSPTPRLVVVVEGARDLPYVEGVVRPLAQLDGIDLWLLSAGEIPEESLGAFGDRLSYIDKLSGPKWQSLLGKLSSDLVLTTLTDLGTKRFPKSGTARYAYVFHSLVSTHVAYEAGAFDGYDIVFCPSDRHRGELAPRDAFCQHTRQLFIAGYPFSDRLVAEQARKSGVSSGDVLIAPSWGNDDAYATLWPQLAIDLGSLGWRVVVRPHPETLKRSPHALRTFEDRVRTCPSVTVDQGSAAGAPPVTAEILITDWSGIALEFSMRPHRQIFLVNLPMKVRNPMWQTIAPSSIELDERHHIGRPIAPDAVETLAAEIGKPGAACPVTPGRTPAWLANPGESGSFIAARLTLELVAGT